MRNWHSGFVAANGIRLHYTRTGGDRPPLVLAHGVTDSGLCWSPLAEALAPEYDVIMVDARGHGESEAPERGYGPAEQAADLAGVIAALGLERPAVLGHSMGAATALVLAGNHPAVPRAILLEDPPAWWAGWSDTPETRERLAQLRARAIALKEQPREASLAAQRAESPGWSEAELQPWADAKWLVSMHALSVFDVANPGSVDWPDVLRRITCPALLIVSEPELGGIVTAENAAALAALVPQLEIAHIPGAGHSIRRDQFARYVEAVRTFLATQRTGAASRAADVTAHAAGR